MPVLSGCRRKPIEVAAPEEVRAERFVEKDRSGARGIGSRAPQRRSLPQQRPLYAICDMRRSAIHADGV